MTCSAKRPAMLSRSAVLLARNLQWTFRLVRNSLGGHRRTPRYGNFAVTVTGRPFSTAPLAVCWT